MDARGQNGTKELETNIGIVGTEAKSTKEKIVKHRRKIWSIPIAALALVLMLAGALVVTSIVQAQAASVKPQVANAVEDFELQINAGDVVGDELTTKVINLADSDGGRPGVYRHDGCRYRW